MSERTLSIVLAGIVLSILAFAFRDSIPSDWRDLIGQTPADRAAAVGRAPFAAAPVPARRSHSAGKTSDVEVSAPQAAPIRNVVAMLPPLLTQADVQPLMKRSELIAKYGQPDLSAMWGDSDGLNERLFYRNGESVVEVVVRDGTILASR